MLYLPSFLRKGVSLGYVGRDYNLKNLKMEMVLVWADTDNPVYEIEINEINKSWFRWLDETIAR